MNIHGATALVTGANRGIGRHLAAQLVERGAKVYATARRPESIDLDGVEVLALDISDPDSVSAAARVAGDVNLLVNNAGIGGGALLGDLQAVRAALDVNFWGTLSMARAFAPVLAANGGGAIVNMASSASWFVFPGSSAYAVSKAAVWSMSKALRQELAGQGTLVTSVHLAMADTDMTKGYDMPKMDPADVARITLDGVETEALEVVVDEFTEMVKASLSKDPREFDKQFHQFLNA
ncbi:NAD(P)-dependent dehydrogenase (short-subunit alcohol dehydrogenase family) [Thermocatellispora tengchongensis]|uniref:NAD(P)-dependent dehydrogenase (Short-subunit alcohol dehydrogenase family) n=1 Tax=Thermocatellispora tengchongensis TaxID=1073253 RepID=A0A840PE83_9ACTN|nr:SDR family oxidoreductase [Thermocatellispora tengchongensis]MBB5137056.1 NAD(P)-dependent dehydrogenase (short-subunit alcohol dehydrogenase family) [Thermocatellispora tengchongensis]